MRNSGSMLCIQMRLGVQENVQKCRLPYFLLICTELFFIYRIFFPISPDICYWSNKFACQFMFQSIVFHVSPHPKFPSFYQCVTFGFFSSSKQEMAYNLFCVLAVYFIPLMVIIVSYTCIMCEISNKSRETNGKILIKKCFCRIFTICKLFVEKSHKNERITQPEIIKFLNIINAI